MFPGLGLKVRGWIEVSGTLSYVSMCEYLNTCNPSIYCFLSEETCAGLGPSSGPPWQNMSYSHRSFPIQHQQALHLFVFAGSLTSVQPPPPEDPVCVCVC